MKDQDKTREQLISELEELRQAEQQARNLLNLLPLGIIECDTAGTITMANPAYERMLGHSLDELLGKNVADFLEPGLQQKSLPNSLQRADEELEQRVKERTAELSSADEQLRLFRRFAEDSAQGFGMADLGGHLLYMNPALCRMLGGYKPEEYLGQHLSICYPEESNRRGREEIEPYLNEHGRWEGELLLLSRQGKVIPTWHSAFLIRKDGEPLHRAVVITDISERKVAEEALRASHDELRAVYDGMSDGLLIADVETKQFVRCNIAMCHMLGYSADELLSRSILDLHPPEHVPEVLEKFRALVESKKAVATDVPMLRKNGSIFYVEISHHEVTYNGRYCSVGIFRDITDRRQAQEAIRQSEERLRLAQQVAQVGSFEGHLETGEIIWTPELEALHGLSAGTFAKTRSAWESMVHSDDLPLVTRLITKALSTSEAVAGEWRVVWPDGSVHWLAGRWQVFYSESGKPLRVIGVNADITERKQAEEALRHSERRFRNYFDQGLIGMAATSLDKQWLAVNDRICEMLGYSENELRRKTWAELTHSEDLARDVEQFERLLAGEIDSYTLDTRFIRKDGTIVYTTILIRAFQKADGSIDHVVALVEDISARTQAEKALRESEERYDLAVRSAGAGIWDYDVKTGKVYYSPRWKQMFGFDENEIGDSLEDWTRLLHPDERDWILKFQDDFLAGTQSTVTIEYRLRRKDGSYRWIVAHGLAVRDEQGRATRMVGSHGDITDRKRAEEALHRERRTLEHMLNASDHERQLIAYDIHDGLAQELAGAIMQFQMYNHQKDTHPQNARKAFDVGTTLLQQAHIEARRLISGVRPPILDESGVMAAIAHLVHDPAFSVGPQIRLRSNVTFTRLAPVVENVIYRIVQEGLTNARNHSKSTRIVVSLVQRGNRLRIEIRDSGVGFDPKTVQEDRFGLEGIRERARLLGGKCRIKSKPCEGTSVVVELPVIEREVEQ